MILIELYSRLENNRFAAIPLLEKMCKKFPNNSHFANWYCYELMNASNLNEVEKLIVSDKSNNIYEIVKAQYYHLSGNYEKSNEILNSLFNNESKIFPWIIEYSKLMRVVNYKMLNDEKMEKKYKQELKDEFNEYYEKIFDKNGHGKNLLRLRELVLVKDYANANPVKENLLNNKLTNAQLAFLDYYRGVENYNIGKIQDAEKKFIKSKSLDNKIFGNDINEYLIHIYKTSNANKNNVEKLIDELEDLDDDRLELSIEELEEKYDL